VTNALATRERSENQMPAPATTNISGIANSLAKKALRISIGLAELSVYAAWKNTRQATTAARVRSRSRRRRSAALVPAATDLMAPPSSI
jgi:hypothetical protein